MNKKTKMYIGLGVVAVVAYYFYNKSKKSANFVSADGCRYTLAKNISGKATYVYEICPNKPPRLAREVKTYN
jgi:hypothetical protein